MRIIDRQKSHHHNRWPAWLFQWGGLFVGLILALWAATQYSNAPLFILFILLTIITLNFSLPPASGGSGLVPIVTISSLLLQPLETAVLIFSISFVLAELTIPLWESVWESSLANRPTRWQRFGQGVVHLLALISSGFIFRVLGGDAPLTETVTANLTPIGSLLIGFGLSYFILTMLLWLGLKRPFRLFWTDIALPNLAFGFLSLPIAILGGEIYLGSGLSGFVIFALGVTVFSIVIRLSWQRRLVLEDRLHQFTALNRTGLLLRETLDLPTVLEQTRQQVLTLVPADKFDIFLTSDRITQSQRADLENGRSFALSHESQTTPNTPISPSDDFTEWVMANGRVLDLDRSNMHFARQHGLTPPNPLPEAWLGIPLTTAEAVIGVMALQRLAPGRPFSQWNREVLLALAGQASAAIQNARLYSETLRLYNLTDEALARRVEQLQALLDGMQEGVLLVDRAGRIALINPFAAVLLNKDASELHRQTLTSAQANRLGYSDEEWESRLAALASGHEPDNSASSFMTTVGIHSQRFITRQETAVRANDGQVMGWLILFRDVTEERELAEQRADLTRMIVHDLRNPLTTLLSTLNLIEQNHENELLLHARLGTHDMLDMVDSLMDLNRMEAGQLVVDAEAMRLPPLVNRVLDRLQPLADQKEITLQFDCNEPLPAVWGDKDVLRRVLINLIDNALKFTPAGGRINGRLQTEPSSTPQREDGLRCTIQDSGPGIPSEFHDRVFDRYMRTNPGGAQVRGTGLGLTFCKLAVEEHNGRIWVEGAADGGSQVVFTLPGVPIMEDEDW